MKEKGIQFNILFAFVFVFPFLIGGYLTHFCAIGSIVLMIVLFASMIRSKAINLAYNLAGLSIGLLAIMYLVTKLWAVDSSMSFVGFVKFLMPVLFMLNLWQVEEEDRADLLLAVPYSATVMTISSALLGQIESIKGYFYDYANDLQGMFQYANAYAIFVLIAIIILILKPHSKPWHYAVDGVCAIACGYGIYASNSRAVWLLSVAMLGVIAVVFVANKLKSKKQIGVYYSALVVIGIAGACVIWALIGEKISNYLITDGPLTERTLYYHDAFLYAIHHPFGKGALAFYFVQPEIQCASYYAIDVHNDFLQMAIEVGIVPMLVFVSVVVYNLVSKKNSYLQRAVLLALTIHALFDFDLQFYALWMVLILCLRFDKQKEYEVNGVAIPAMAGIAVIMLNAIIGLSCYCNYSGLHDKSVYYYKNTPSMLMILNVNNDQQKGYELANDILKKNDNIFEANAVLSAIYSENDRYDEAVEQMELVLKKNPRNMSNYESYIDLCDKAHKYYIDNGEAEKAELMSDKIKSVPDALSTLEQNTPERAKLYGKEQIFELDKAHQKKIMQYNKKEK